MTPPIERKDRLHILLSDQERQMLEGLANHKGVSPSDWLRLIIRESWLRCAWCGAEMKLREWTGERKPWRLVDDVNVCADCASSVLAGRPSQSKDAKKGRVRR